LISLSLVSIKMMALLIGLEDLEPVSFLNTEELCQFMHPTDQSLSQELLIQLIFLMEQMIF
jgi:hypothetical protein